MSLSSPKVTVLMPVYNSEQYLNESIESILNQTFHDFELIIVHRPYNNDSGKIKEIIKQYSDKRIKYQEQLDSGYAEAINQGFNLAKGEYVCIQDSDDISFPDRLEKEVRVLESKPDVELVFSPVLFMDKEGNVFAQWGGRGQQLSKENAFYDLYINGNFIPNPSVMMRKRHVNGDLYSLDLRFCNDFEHQLRVAHDYPIFEITHPLAKIRRGEGHQSMTANRELNFLAEQQIIKTIHSRFRHSHPKVGRIHYMKAMSNQFLKEGLYFGGQRAIKLFFKAILFNPVNIRVWHAILNAIVGKLVPIRIKQIIKHLRKLHSYM